MQELQIIQAKLKAPKGQFNSFGGFKYRSLEDIYEAVKPLLAETQTSLVVGDEIELIGDRYYVCATATLTNQKGEQVRNVAYAREDKEKSKMDGSQLTGSASSYARKYALNGLFCIDDTKDADTDEYTKVQEAKGKKPTAKASAPAQPAMTAEMRKTLDDAKTVEEMTLSIERFRNWSAQVAGIYLPSTADRDALFEIEREVRNNKQYL